MTGPGEPLCTIAIPVYHRRNKSLAFAAIDSALAEPRQDIEIVVIDDHTTDGTWDELQKLRDPRVRLLRNEENVGLFANFNRCLDEAHGRYVRILCSDDMLELGTLDEELAVMERHPDMALLTTRGLRVSASGEVLGEQAAALAEGCYRSNEAIAAVLRANAGTGYNALNYPSGVLLRRSAAEAAGRFSTQLRMVGDVEYFLRILREGKMGVLDRVGCRITVHPQQVGTELSLQPVVMQELFELARLFEGLLRDAAALHRVRRWLAGLSVWQAVRSTIAGDARGARAHLSVAMQNDVNGLQMIGGFLNFLALRARWILRGPFVPGAISPESSL